MAGSMERWIGKAAIVTGASSGIGYAIAEQLVNNGVKVIGVARRQAKLAQLKQNLQNKKGQIYTFAADISKEEDVLNLFKWTKENVGPIHILVNNAGVLRITNLTEGDTKLWKETIDIQVLGLCIATREAVQDMRANNVDGHIIHINSIDGHKIINVPNVNVFPATKFAVTALTETLRNELNSFGSKIKVSSISPGFVNDTDIVETGVLASNTGHDAPLIDSSKSLKSEDVANAVVYVLSTPPHVQIHELIIQHIAEIF